MALLTNIFLTGVKLVLTSEHRQAFTQDGYVTVKGLFRRDEAEFYKDYYTRMRLEENTRMDQKFATASANDPLVQWPRLMMMHRHDEISRQWLLDPRINACLTGLLGREPYAVQTMFYFKPPHARGQALHQDNYYLRVQPGTCVAAWMAVDRCDEANGCLQVVPGSQNWPILCTTKADVTQSFTDVTVPIPDDHPAVPVIMEPGDVLFFNGQIVHGSLSNTTDDRFRCSLIAHYIEGDAQQVARWYFPVLRMDGSEVELEQSPSGSQCGIWVDRDGQPVIEVNGYVKVERATE
jgi:ectoine hydroxylase-related dioxygenase (phytanoyl-CoA dioxygenase family)